MPCCAVLQYVKCDCVSVQKKKSLELEYEIYLLQSEQSDCTWQRCHDVIRIFFFF